MHGTRGRATPLLPYFGLALLLGSLHAIASRLPPIVTSYLLSPARYLPRLTLKSYESFPSVSACVTRTLSYVRPTLSFSRARNSSRKEHQGEHSGHSRVEARIYVGLIKLRFHLRVRRIDFKRR